MKIQKVYLLIFFLTNIILAFGQTSPNKEKLFIPNGKVALIGYGSLMSIASMERTLGHAYTDKFLPIHINGFQRVWNFATPNNGIRRPDLFYFIMAGDTIYPTKVMALNIQENHSKSMNACLFIIDTLELKMFDAREFGYSRIKLNDKIKEFEMVNGDVYAYKALPDFTIKVTDNPKDNVISRSYIKTVEEDGLLALGQQFREEYYSSTLPYSPKILMTRNVKPFKK
jgi:hypothetical protein